MPFLASLATIGRVLVIALAVVVILSEISTLVGSGLPGFFDGSVRFNEPFGVAVDSEGNVYVGDTINNRIRKITPAGLVTTLAGSSQGFADGTGAGASFNLPRGVAVDSAGTVYVADESNHRIRKITPAGVVTTLAGSGTGQFADGTGAGASFRFPLGIAVDSAGTVYVADTVNHRIRRISPLGVVTTLAGSSSGYLDGTGTNATFSSPRALTFDSVGNLYVADYGNNRIRRITSEGVVTTLAGSGTAGSADGTGTNATFHQPNGITIDSMGNLYVADYGNNRIRKITPAGVVTTFAGSTQGSGDGTGTNATFFAPHGLVTDSVGTIYVADLTNHRIRKITPAGVVTTFAGSGVAGFTDSITPYLFNYPYGVAVDSTGHMYVAEFNSHRIRKITPAGVVTTLAGTTPAFQDGTGTNASFYSPQGIAVDSAGNVYVGDTINQRIRKITPAGVVTTLAGSLEGFNDGTGTSARFSSPRGVAVDSVGNVYVADQALNHRIRKITPAGVVTTLAGNGGTTFTDGTGISATFNNPSGVAVDSAGNVYVADRTNHRIRKVTTQLVPDSILTLAGRNTIGSTNGTGTNALFNQPKGLAVDSAGNVFVADLENALIRKITPEGVVTTFAGNGTQSSINGTGTNASFYRPSGLVFDSAGNLYVGELYGCVIRKITPAGVVTTFVGGIVGYVDGTGTNARFYYIEALAIDSAGNLYVSSQLDYAVRKVTPEGVVTTLAGSGTSGYADGTGTSAQFSSIYAITVDSAGNVYVADRNSNNRVRKITPAGVVTTFAGSGTYAFADGTGTNASFYNINGLVADKLGNVYVTDGGNCRVRKITPGGVVTTFAGTGSNGNTDGPIATATIDSTTSHMTIDSNGNLYFSSQGTWHNVRKINTTSGSSDVTTLAGQATAGSSDGTGTNASFNNPFAVAVDSVGNVYVGEDGINRIRKITPAGVVTTLAGQTGAGSTDGTGTNATFSGPYGITVDSSNNLYVADSNNQRIRKITPAGVVTTLAGSTQGYNDGGWFTVPVGVATDWDGTVYVADTNNHRIRKITPAGVVSTFAGQTTAGTTNATGTSARFNFPRGVALDSVRNVYVADIGNHRIRRITPEGVVTTFAGTTQGSTDGVGTSARFNTPSGIVADIYGNVYVADTNNHRIRRITSDGTVTTLAGSTAGIADGVGTNASFNTPSGIVADIYGNVYVADTNNHRIRRITSDGTVTTLAGSTAGFDDGMGINARFNFPYHLSIDALGTLYVADQTNNRIRTVQTSTGVVSTLAGDGTAGFTPSRFNTPQGITLDRFRNAYVGDTGNHSIRKIPNVFTVPENNGVVTTIAGDGTASFADGTGIGVSFNQPNGVAVDSAGNLYIADVSNHRIRKITPVGVVTTLAGNGTTTFTNGTGAGATFNQPNGVAVDSAGNVYVADKLNNRIRKITPEGVVTTLAGSGTATFADGTGTSASLYWPLCIAVDLAGNVYVGDQGNQRIRKITSVGVVTTLAGNGTTTFANGTGTNATINTPTGIAVDLAGNVYVGDQGNQRIRKITSVGVVTTLAGSGTGNFADGTGTNASFFYPNGVAVDSEGNVYLCDGGNNRIRKITPAGVVTTLAGNGTTTFTNGIGTNVTFNGPAGIAVDSGGILYIGDQANHRIRKIGTTVAQLPLNQAIVTTLAGSTQGSTNGTGTNATFSTPYAVAVDSTGHVYVADAGNHRIRKITPAGVVTTLAGSGTAGSTNGTGTNATFNSPQGIAVDSAGNVYVGDSQNSLIRKITPTGVVSTLAGQTTQGSTDGTGTNATFFIPQGLAVDSTGNVYVADTTNHRIRKITPAGVVTTFAGSGITGSSDGTGTNARFIYPEGLAVDSGGIVYVADTGNQRIRKITPGGVVTTLAGQNNPGSTDGTGTNARFENPTGVAVDSAGNLYVAEWSNNLIRKITPAGVVTRLAGQTSAAFADGTGTNAQFSGPRRIAVDSGGIVYVADTGNQRIRKIQ